MSQEDVEIVRRALDAFNSEGARAPFDAGLVSDDLEVRTAFGLTGEKVYVGREGWEQFMRLWTEPFDDWTLEVASLVDAGDAVVGRLRQTGRGRQSGAFVENEFGAVFRFRQGQIASGEVFMELTEALKAAGLSEGG